jgi:hypothetical protein
MTEREWPADQFTEIGGSDELTIVMSRSGRDTLRIPIWVVSVDGSIYVRSYKGVTALWFRRAEADPKQAIVIGGRDVATEFRNVDRTEHIHKKIDEAYTRKYARFDYVSAMSEPAAVEATFRLLPLPAS